jgi:predicted metal-dependent HD superfamily phosphohydrolase
MQVTVNGSVWNLGALSGQRWANVTNSRAQLKEALAASPVNWNTISAPASMIIATAAAVATPASGNSTKFADMATAMLNANTMAWMEFAGKLADYMLDGVGDAQTTATTATTTTASAAATK